MFRFMMKTLSVLLIIIANTCAFEPFFYSRVDYQMGGYIECITTADFNNDGYLDFACGSDTYVGETFTHINIYLNNGDGTYLDPVAVNSGYAAKQSQGNLRIA